MLTHGDGVAELAIARLHNSSIVLASKGRSEASAPPAHPSAAPRPAPPPRPPLDRPAQRLSSAALPFRPRARAQPGVSRSPALLRIECHFGRRLPRKNLPEPHSGNLLGPQPSPHASWPRDETRHGGWPSAVGQGGWPGNPPQMQMQPPPGMVRGAADGSWLQQEIFMLQMQAQQLAQLQTSVNARAHALGMAQMHGASPQQQAQMHAEVQMHGQMQAQLQLQLQAQLRAQQQMQHGQPLLGAGGGVGLPPYPPQHQFSPLGYEPTNAATPGMLPPMPSSRPVDAGLHPPMPQPQVSLPLTSTDLGAGQLQPPPNQEEGGSWH